jgi:hypothetical protein
MIVGDLAVTNDDMMREYAADRFVESQPIASSGTLNSVHVLVRPACSSSSAFSAKCRAHAAAYAWKYVRARSRSIAFDHFGTCHSNSTSGFIAVCGIYILTLLPVAFT